MVVAATAVALAAAMAAAVATQVAAIAAVTTVVRLAVVAIVVRAVTAVAAMAASARLIVRPAPHTPRLHLLLNQRRAPSTAHRQSNNVLVMIALQRRALARIVALRVPVVMTVAHRALVMIARRAMAKNAVLPASVAMRHRVVTLVIVPSVLTHHAKTARRVLARTVRRLLIVATAVLPVRLTVTHVRPGAIAPRRAASLAMLRNFRRRAVNSLRALIVPSTHHLMHRFSVLLAQTRRRVARAASSHTTCVPNVVATPRLVRQ